MNNKYIYIQKICELLFLLSTYLCAVRIHSYDSSFCLAHCLSLSLSSMLWLSHSSSSDNTHSYMCICFRKNTYSMSHSTTPNQRVWKTVTSALYPYNTSPQQYTHTPSCQKKWKLPTDWNPYTYTHTHTLAYAHALVIQWWTFLLTEIATRNPYRGEGNKNRKK